MNRLPLVIWLLSALAAGLRAQGTLALNTATGIKPRITIDGVNATLADNVWVEVLVAGSTNLTGAGAHPFRLTLPGAIAGLFSKGILTVWGVSAGAFAEVTIRAWDQDTGADYEHGLCRASQTFYVELGGIVGPDGVAGLPNSIVGGGLFSGLNLACNWPPPPPPPTTIFGPLPPPLNAELSLVRIVEAATPLDLNQDGIADFLLARIQYYEPPTNQVRLTLQNPKFSRMFLAAAKTRLSSWWADPRLEGADPMPIEGTNLIGVAFPAPYSRNYYLGWVLVTNGVLIDYGYGRFPGQSIVLGEKPAGIVNLKEWYIDYQIADVANSISGQPAILLRRERRREGERFRTTTVLIGSPGEFLAEIHPGSSQLFPQALPVGMVVPAKLPDPEVRSANVFLAEVFEDLDEQLLLTSSWNQNREGRVAFRSRSLPEPAPITWVAVSGGGRPSIIGSGRTGVVGDRGDSRISVGSDSNFQRWEMARTPLDLNRDGLADFILAKFVYERGGVNSPQYARSRALDLESVLSSDIATLELGGDQILQGVVLRRGCFGTGQKIFPTQFPTSVGRLAGEITVVDPGSGAVTTRYEPLPQTPLILAEPASLNLNVWRLPLGGARVTWPAEHAAYVLEQSASEAESTWQKVQVGIAGQYDIPLDARSLLFRLRHRTQGE